MQELQTGRERGHFNNLFCFRNMKMEFLQIKYSSLSYTGWSERYYKWLCRHIPSFFASLWERQKGSFHCASWWQTEAWMVTQGWHFSSFPVIEPKDLNITQNCCTCPKDVSWNTLLSRSEDRLSGATFQAGEQLCQYPQQNSTLTHAGWAQEWQSRSKLAEPNPRMRKKTRLKRVQQAHCYLLYCSCRSASLWNSVIGCLSSYHSCCAHTQIMRFQQCLLARLCFPLESLKQAVQVPHRYVSVLRLLPLAFISVGISKIVGVCETC